MIKVNYDINTNKVIGFNKNIEPFIEITEEERRQPIKNKYGYYAVEDNHLVVKYRVPIPQEVLADQENAIKQQITALKRQLAETDYKAIKFAEGFIPADEYTEIKAQRQNWRTQINQLEVELNEIHN